MPKAFCLTLQSPNDTYTHINPLRMKFPCSTGLVSIFFDSSTFTQQLHPQPKNRLAAANKSPSTETKICGGKVMGEGES